jgi:hypothetical protein
LITVNNLLKIYYRSFFVIFIFSASCAHDFELETLKIILSKPASKLGGIKSNSGGGYNGLGWVGNMGIFILLHIYQELTTHTAETKYNDKGNLHN